MNRSKIALSAAALAATAVLAAYARPAFQDEAMQMPQPTKQHQEMLKGVGEWEGTLTSYMDPSGQAMTVPAHETVTGIGGFWLLSNFHCEFMGTPYHGSGHYGYDAARGKYVGTWVDSMSSHLAVMEGEIDPKTHALVMRWEGPDPTGKMTPHRSESVEEGDKRSMTFYMGEGAGQKTMTIEMKRKAGKPVGAGATK